MSYSISVTAPGRRDARLSGRLRLLYSELYLQAPNFTPQLKWIAALFECGVKTARALRSALVEAGYLQRIVVKIGSTTVRNYFVFYAEPEKRPVIYEYVDPATHKILQRIPEGEGRPQSLGESIEQTEPEKTPNSAEKFDQNGLAKNGQGHKCPLNSKEKESLFIKENLEAIPLCQWKPDSDDLNRWAIMGANDRGLACLVDRFRHWRRLEAPDKFNQSGWSLEFNRYAKIGFDLLPAFYRSTPAGHFAPGLAINDEIIF